MIDSYLHYTYTNDPAGIAGRSHLPNGIFSMYKTYWYDHWKCKSNNFTIKLNWIIMKN